MNGIDIFQSKLVSIGNHLVELALASKGKSARRKELGTMMPSRIRSGYQRRILDELVEGPATVSELALRIGLATSHTSSTLRSLREAGLVHRDADHGLRGAAHLLTEEGAQRLHHDALSRLRIAMRTEQGRGRHVILSRDGSTVVIGYDGIPRSDLVWLPARTAHPDFETPIVSSGNERGGAWCLLRGEPRWVNRSTLALVPAPSEHDDPEDILSWSASERPLAILRGRLLDDDGSWGMAPGTWFDDERSTPERGPAILSSGPVDLGRIKGTALRCSPQAPVVGRVPEGWIREALLSSSSGICITRSERPPDAPQRPVSLLTTWLRLRHPRLHDLEINTRANHLLQRLLRPSSGRTTVLERAVLADFGLSTWTEEPVHRLELARCSEAGTTATWLWALDVLNLPFRGEWTLDTSSTRLLHRIVSDARCELLVAMDARLDDIEAPTHLLLEQNEGTVVVEGRYRLSVEVNKASTGGTHRIWEGDLPEHANDLLSIDPKATPVIEGPRSTQHPDLPRREALAAWPDGDDALADELEHIDPIASWIASTVRERERRWERLHDRVPASWMALHDVKNASAGWLVRHASNGDEAYRAAAALHLVHVLQDREEAEERWNASSSTVASAARLLASPPGQPAKASDIDAWISDPLHFEVLLPVHWEAVADRIASKEGDVDERLDTWKAWRQSGTEVMSTDVIMSICERFPMAWWAAWSMPWLTQLAATARGRRWLASTRVPWVVACSLGEEGQAPGLPPRRVEEVAAAALVDLHLVDEGPGHDGVHDVLEAVIAREEQRPPPRGRSHVHACWLLWPTEAWPPYVGLGGRSDAVDLEINRRRVQSRRR